MWFCVQGFYFSNNSNELEKDRMENDKVQEITKILSGMTAEQQAQFVLDNIKNQQNQQMSDEVLKIYKRISRLEFVVGVLKTDQMMAKLYIDDKILIIPAEKIENQKIFKEQYIREFKKLAPLILPNDWRTLINAVIENKSETVECQEESFEVHVAREIWSILQGLEISSDIKQYLNTGRALLDRGDYCLVRSDRMEKIVKDKDYNIAMNKLSTVMTELGFKTPGTKKYNDKRSWFLIKSELVKKNSTELSQV